MVRALCRGCLAAALGLLLSGCLTGPYPSQTHPSCSWTSQPPSNADQLCKEIFRTLTTIVNAEVGGNDHTIRKLVTDPGAAGRISAYGRHIRADGVKELHVVPSFTLGRVRGGLLGAGFYLVGTARHGSLNAREQIYLRIQHGKAIVVQDQFGQEW